MNVIGAVRSLLRGVFGGAGRFGRFDADGIPFAALWLLGMQLALGLQPIRQPIAIRATRFLPQPMSPVGDAFVTDQ